MRKAAGIYLRARRNVADGAATHDTEPRFPGNFLHATAVFARPPHARGADVVPEPHEISSHMPVRQQRSPAQTGTYGDPIPVRCLPTSLEISLVTRE